MMRRVVGLFLLAAGLLCLGQPAAAAPAAADWAALDAFVTAQMAKHGLPGVALAVTRGTDVVYLKAYGTAGAGRPLTPQTPMYIGSQSKSFTALAVAQLVEQGKIEVEAPVQTYLPWFRVADPEASGRITVSHLLHHTSGLAEGGFAASLPDTASSEAAARALATARLTEPVGTKFQYFNFGYDVLAAIVEAVSGESYERYLQAHLLDPLGLTHTYTDPALARQAGLAQGYSRLFGFAVPRAQPHRRYEVAAGYIISTAEDLARYAIALNNDAAVGDTRLLQPGGLQRLFQPVQGYGWGWFVEPGRIYHGGANETFKTYVTLYPLQKLGLVVLINEGYLFDHYISAEQVYGGVAAIVRGFPPPAVAPGWSTQVMGWLLLAFVLALGAFQTFNVLSLRTWRARARTWSPARRAWDMAVSFLIPSVILAVVFWQVRGFFGYRFNLAYQLRTMWANLPDISLLCLIGTVPDYAQGLVKLFWLVGPGARPAAAAEVRA
ncbi:MAG: beta-lactamase family protein [Anaerolineales bacterium]|nr:beta-lactamase family protein [Anaerolineales bacterium]